MATHGGKRAGAGKPKGRKNTKTLEKMAIQEAFNQRVMIHADKLFQAQLQIAVGSVRIFRVEEKRDKKGNVNREHVLVTSPAEMKRVLDENDGESGIVGDTYYFVNEVPPQNAAIESMLNRTLGKPKENIEHSGKDGKDLIPSTILVEIVRNDGTGNKANENQD